MTDFEALRRFTAAPDIQEAIEGLRREHVVALRQAPFGLRRGVLRSGFELPAGGTVWRSLWLLTHRPLRRGGVRRHPASAAVLVAWRGLGLVLLRGPQERRSVELAPPGSGPDAGAWYVHLPPGTYYDTLADATPWQILAFHSEAATHLMREEETQEGWTPKPEEADS